MPTADEFHVLLLRHGQTDANAGGVLQGWRPVPLNAAGRAQSAHLAARLESFAPRVRRLVSSDLVRARQTAEPIAAALGLPIEFDARWRERGLGELEGQTIGERETWRTAAGEFDPAGAEPVPAFQARAADALQSLLPPPGDAAGWAASPVAVVTHGGTLRSILRLFAEGRLPHAAGTDMPDPADPALQTIANCSILQLTAGRFASGATGATWRIACVNDVSHLESGEVTARDSG